MSRIVTSFDSVVLAAVARDVTQLTGWRVARIVQPAREEIAIDLRGARGAETLLCSIDPRWARVHLTSSGLPERPAPEDATEPSPFAQMLRRRLDRARLLAMQQPLFERVLVLTFETLEGPADLHAEIMGRYSNLILTQQGIIVGSLKQVPKTKSSVREVLPGRPFTPPPRDRPTPAELTIESLAQLLAAGQESVVKSLTSRVMGLSPATARELAVRARLDPDAPATGKEAASQLWGPWQELVAVAREGRFTPLVYFVESEPIGYAPFPFAHLTTLRAEPVASMSEAVDIVVAHHVPQARLEEQRTSLLAVVKTALARAARTETEMQQALAEAERSAALKEQGELLLAYASRIPAGAPDVTLPGYDGTAVTISLDPNLSPVENAQKIFKRYSKVRAARPTLAHRLREAAAEREYLESLRAMVEQMSSAADLVEFRRELAAGGYLRIRSRPSRSDARRAPVRLSPAAPRTFVLPTGETVLVGRTNLENDRLTFKVAAPDDLWFHARGAPGAHVILRLTSKKPSERAIRRAAAIAAFFSQARGSGTVAVDCTARRHVRKPRGAKPGMVVYEREQTIHVKPELPQ